MSFVSRPYPYEESDLEHLSQSHGGQRKVARKEKHAGGHVWNRRRGYQKLCPVTRGETQTLDSQTREKSQERKEIESADVCVTAERGPLRGNSRMKGP